MQHKYADKNWCKEWLCVVRSLMMVFALGGLSAHAVADIQVISTFKDGGPACDVQIAGGGCFSRPNGTYFTWAEANSYCNGLGGGYYLPTKDELLSLYSHYPNGKINTVLGWPTNSVYWSSTQLTAGYHNYVYMLNGDVGFNDDNTGYYVTCIR